MPDFLIDFFRDFPPEVATVLLAMLPIAELRGALPAAIVVYDLPVWKAILLSIIGNMLPVYFLLIGFERVSQWLRVRFVFFDVLFNKLFDKTRQKLESKVDKYGVWALALFVAIPLPVTGAWTGTLAAFVFGLSKKKSFFAIFVGLLMAATIVTVLTLATVNTVDAFRA